MREIIDISTQDIKPNRAAVLETQGVPPNKELPERILSIFDTAMELLLKFSHPRAILADISIPEFDALYKGEGLNEKETPLGTIFRKADNLALFAVTIGEQVSQKINELFNINEFAKGSMLDAVASVGIDKTGDIMEKHFLDLLRKEEKLTPSTGILRYSPGYCGWHISGQKKLFEFLHPEDIGITLLESYLMKPLKSISGIIVAGNREIHIFKDTFPFCKQCKTHSCRGRIRSMLKKSLKRE